MGSEGLPGGLRPPELETAARRTLSYVDNANLAPRITARTVITVGLRDTITPPSTVFAAFNAIESQKEMVVLPYAGHELPTSHTERSLADFARELDGRRSPVTDRSI